MKIHIIDLNNQKIDGNIDVIKALFKVYETIIEKGGVIEIINENYEISESISNIENFEIFEKSYL